MRTARETRRVRRSCRRAGIRGGAVREREHEPANGHVDEFAEDHVEAGADLLGRLLVAELFHDCGRHHRRDRADVEDRQVERDGAARAAAFISELLWFPYDGVVPLRLLPPRTEEKASKRSNSIPARLRMLPKERRADGA